MSNAKLIGAIVVVGLGGCGEEPEPEPQGPVHPELRFDAVFEGRWLHVYAMEVHDEPTCDSLGFPTIGTCDITHDAEPCTTHPGSWLSDARLVHDGATIAHARTFYESPLRATMELDGPPPAGTHLVIGTDDGPPIDVLLPPAPARRPEPIIDSISYTGTIAHLAWHTTPRVPHAIVEAHGGFGGPRCHVVDHNALDLDLGWAPRFGDDIWVSVRASPAPAVIEHHAGLVYVWHQRAVFVEWPVPPP